MKYFTLFFTLFIATAVFADAPTNAISQTEINHVLQSSSPPPVSYSTDGGADPTLIAEDLTSLESIPHTLLIQDPLLGTMGSVPNMNGEACFNGAFDLASYSDKQTACLNQNSGFLSLSYGF